MADDEDVLRWPVGTTEYIHVDVTSSVDPLGDDVKLALVPHRGEIAGDSADLQAAEWEPDQQWQDGTPVTVRRLIAAGTLTRGQKYDVWVQVTDNPEVPLISAGVVKGV